MSAPYDNYPAKWKGLLEAYAKAYDATQISAEDWCNQAGVSYGSAKRYITRKAAKAWLENASKPSAKSAKNARAKSRSAGNAKNRSKAIGSKEDKPLNNKGNDKSEERDIEGRARTSNNVIPIESVKQPHDGARNGAAGNAKNRSSEDASDGPSSFGRNLMNVFGLEGKKESGDGGDDGEPPGPRDGCCNATTRSGGYCQMPAGWGTHHFGTGRCKLHGGKSEGAPARNQNASKHGIYSQFESEDERQALDDVDTHSLEGEIRVVSRQLMRTLQRQMEYDQLKQHADGGSVPVEMYDDARIEVGVGTGNDGIQFVKQMPDFNQLVHRFTTNLSNLKLKHARLIHANTLTYLNQAELLQEVLSEKEDKGLTALEAAYRLMKAGVMQLPPVLEKEVVAEFQDENEDDMGDGGVTPEQVKARAQELEQQYAAKKEEALAKRRKELEALDAEENDGQET